MPRPCPRTDIWANGNKSIRCRPLRARANRWTIGKLSNNAPAGLRDLRCLVFNLGRPESAFAILAPPRYVGPMSTLAEIERAAKVLPVDQKERLVASLLAGLRKEGVSKVAMDEAARASLLPLAATAWSQDWDTAEEDEAWRDL